MFFNHSKACNILLENTFSSVHASDNSRGEKFSREVMLVKDISCHPTVIQVKGSDGSIGDCFSVACKWAFDSC
jgi:hypothetical protein